jgi:hypothetical protein
VGVGSREIARLDSSLAQIEKATHHKDALAAFTKYRDRVITMRTQTNVIASHQVNCAEAPQAVRESASAQPGEKADSFLGSAQGSFAMAIVEVQGGQVYQSDCDAILFTEIARD